MKKLFTLFFLLLLAGAYSSFGQTISGTYTVCTGGTTSLTGTPAGGTWSSSSMTVTTVNPTSGVASGIAAGTAMVTYTTGSGFATTVVTVNPIPVFSLSPSTISCGATSTISAISPGGIWSIGAPFSGFGVATLSGATGVITGVSPGTITVSYRIGTCAATNILTVLPAASVSVSGPTIACAGATISLVPSLTGGSWTASNTNATVNIVGDVTGVTTGVDTITYTMSPTCGSASASHVVTVTTTATIAPITGTLTVPCGGTTTLANATAGGTWVTATPPVAIIGSASGVVTAFAPGTVTIEYHASIGCGTAIATAVVTVTPSTSAGTITGASTICDGASTALSGSVPGGTWSSSVPTIAPVSSTGVVTGLTAGILTISYTVSSACGTATATHMMTVNPTPVVGLITGTTTLACGGATTLSNSVSGGSWSSSAIAVGTIDPLTGVVAALTPGTSTISYILSSSCGADTATDVLTVTPISVSASVSPITCSDNYAAVASGATTYSWGPTTGVACPTCATTNINPSATATYTVTGSSGVGCSATATVTVNGDRIKGHVTFPFSAPTSATSKVWLIQFNPTDSSIVALDSQLTCNDGTDEYYQFDSKPAGNYLVKAILLSSVPGTTDYMPSYGAAALYWGSATTINHTGATAVQDIAMFWGPVPSGPGFISGYVYAGAGKGTSGEAPVEGMLIFLKDGVSGQVLTYTYTNASGAYSFNTLGYGSYVIYPEEYKYSTTPSSVITLDAAHPSSTGVSFKQHTNMGTITPWSLPNNVATVTADQHIAVFPNPATDAITIKWADIAQGNISLRITDIVGKEVYTAVIENGTTSGESRVELSQLPQGVYMIRIQSADIHYTQKFFLER